MANSSGRDTVQKSLQDFVYVIKDIVLLNEVYSTHKYVEGTMQPNLDTLLRTKTRTESEWYRAKMEYLTAYHDIQYKRFLMNMTLVTLMFLCLSALAYGFVFMNNLPDPKAYIKMLGIAIGCLFVIYLVVIVLMYKNVSKRTNYNWNRIYFKPPSASS